MIFIIFKLLIVFVCFFVLVSYRKTYKLHKKLSAFTKEYVRRSIDIHNFNNHLINTGSSSPAYPYTINDILAFVKSLDNKFINFDIEYFLFYSEKIARDEQLDHKGSVLFGPWFNTSTRLYVFYKAVSIMREDPIKLRKLFGEKK